MLYLHKTRLDNALAMNEPLSKAYSLKEQLREIWSQISKEEAEAVLDDWVKQARESKIPQLMRMAATHFSRVFRGNSEPLRSSSIPLRFHRL